MRTVNYPINELRNENDRLSREKIKEIILHYWKDIPEDKLHAGIETYFSEGYTNVELIEMFDLLEITDTEGK